MIGDGGPAPGLPILARLSWPRLLALSSLSFAVTLAASSLESAVFGHKVLRILPDSPNTLLGFSTFAGSVLAIFLGPLIGALSDRTRGRYGRRRPFIAVGVFTFLVAFVLIARSSGVAAFVAGVLLFRASDSLVYTNWASLYPDRVPESQRGRGAGFKAMVDIVGVIVGRFTAGELLARFPVLGPQAVLAAVAVPSGGLVFALIVTLFALRDLPSPDLPENPPPVLESLKVAFTVDGAKHPGFHWWFVNRALYWTGFIIIFQFFLLFIIDVVGFSEPDAQRFLARLAVVAGAAVLVIALPAGTLADRIGRRPLVILGCGLASLASVLIIIVREPAYFLGAAAVLGVGAGIFVSSDFALLTDIVPGAAAGRYLGLANIASAGGAAVARLLGGALVDPLNRLSGSSTAGYVGLYSVAALLLLLSLAAAIKLPAFKPTRAGAE